jgi:hypothetical protein
MKRLALALLLASGAASAQPPPPAVNVVPVLAPDMPPPRPPAPLPDLERASEAELRALLGGHRLDPGPRAEAIRIFRRRFTGEAARAFALNAEARSRLDAWETDRALALYRDVRRRFGGSRLPEVKAEVAAAMQGEVQAIDMADARADTGALRPLTPADIDLASPSNRLRREIVERFAGRPEPAIRRIVAQERRNLLQAETIRAGRLADPERDLALVREYENSDDPEIRQLVARILFDVAHSFGDERAAISHWNEFLRRFGQETNESMRSLVSDAYDNRHFVLERLGDHEAADRSRAEQWAWSERAFAADR